MTISYATAFIGGLVTILAPCASMLLPAFFAYAFTSRTTMAARTLAFVAGLMVALVPLGMAAGTIGQLLSRYRHQVTVVAGIIIIVLGIIMALSLPFPQIRMPSRTNKTGGQAATTPAVFVLGISYGLAGAGCTGPILGGVLMVAGNTGSALHGSIVMAFYALGMATPVVLLAFLWDAFDIGSKKFLRPKPVTFLGRHTTVGSLISGGLFIILGIALVITGGVANVGILDAFQQSNLETAIMGAFNGIPDWLFMVLIVALIVLLVMAFRSFSKRRQTANADKDVD